ncbi:uncharacterized protein LOC141721522 [Apium graveolens]|uniref:uncharacterized protein LOC141721522 n=1 Tax=Apium graveolens TaxID=4045 RepID=UPI003D7AB79E
MLHKDMMSFGYLGNGGLSSAASNLSPLAPPFTVDRSNTKFDSNLISNFSENNYGVPFSSSLHDWQYPQPSASAPEYYSNYESEIGSLHTTEYSYPGSGPINPPNVHWAPPNPNTTDPKSNPFSYSGAPKQYYPTYQVVDDSVSSVGLSEANYELLSSSGIVPVAGSSQVDYSQGLSSLEFAPPWGGYWNGLSEGNCGRRTDIDGSFHFEEADFPGPHVYRDYLNQEVVPVEFSRCKENSTATQRKYADVYGNEKNAQFLARDQLDDSLCQNLRSGPTESLKAPFLGTSTKITESNLKSPSQEPVTFSSNLRKSNSLCGNGLQLFDSCISDCTSVTKTSVLPVIRPPIFGTSFPIQNTVASKNIDIGDVTAVNRKDVSTYNQTIEKEPLLPPITEFKEGFLDANHIGFHASRNDQHIYSPASSSLAKSLSNNSLNHGIKVRGGQIPDINVPHGSTMSVDGTEALKRTNTTENSDNHNPAEDSPCWKGAPASMVSPFELLEAIPPQNRLKKLETRDLLDFEAVQKFPPHEFVVDFSSQVCEPKLSKENLSPDYTKAVLPMNNLDATLPAKEFLAADDAKLKSDGVEQNRNIGDQYSSNVGNPIKQYNLLDTSKSHSGSVQSQTQQLCPKEVSITPNMAGAEDAGTSTCDTLEDGCIPLHYVENVLYSPHSEEGDGQPPVMESSQKVNIQTMASALQNISKLLLLYSFDDEWELKEQESKTLEHAMRNINLCLSKKIVQLTPKQETMFSNAKTSHILKEGATQSRLNATDDVGNTTVDHLDSYSMHEKKRIFGVSDKEIEKNMDFVSLRNDADVTRHHNMVQNIKKVLNENFQLEEDISSETLLYKNLWLNAEAELCVTGLNSRFDKVKIQLEDCKSYETKENSVILKKSPSSNVSPDPCLDVASGLTPEINESQKQTTSVPCILSTRSDVNDDEASVMARFQILKCRGDNTNTTVEEKSLPNDVQPDDADVNDVDDSVMARFQILKCRGDNVNESTVEWNSLPDDTDVNDVEDYVMAGFHVLKFQGENMSTSNVEEKSLPDVMPPEGTNFEVSRQIVGSQTGNRSFDVAVGSRVHPHSDHGNAKNIGSSLHDPKHETVKEEDSVMARLQILKCRGDNINTSDVEEKSLPDVVQPEGTDVGVPWQIVGSQTGNKSFDVAVGSRVHSHSDHGNAKNVVSSPYDSKHETVKEFSVYASDDTTTIQSRRNISMHNELASGSGWHKNTPSDWDDSTRLNTSMHNELASGTGWQKNTSSDWDDLTTIQPHRNISMHNELASDWDDSGSGWRKSTPSDWDNSGSGWGKNTLSDWDDSGSAWRKSSPSVWDDSTTIQPHRNISMHNNGGSGSVWHKNTPSDWNDSTTIQPRGNINMHNEHASGSGWYENTPLDWEHVLKDDYVWNK